MCPAQQTAHEVGHPEQKVFDRLERKGVKAGRGYIADLIACRLGPACSSVGVLHFKWRRVRVVE